MAVWGRYEQYYQGAGGVELLMFNLVLGRNPPLTAFTTLPVNPFLILIPISKP